MANIKKKKKYITQTSIFFESVSEHFKVFYRMCLLAKSKEPTMSLGPSFKMGLKGFFIVQSY